LFNLHPFAKSRHALISQQLVMASKLVRPGQILPRSRPTSGALTPEPQPTDVSRNGQVGKVCILAAFLQFSDADLRIDARFCSI